MADAITHYLKSEWLTLFEGLPVDARLVDSYFFRLMAAYTEPHRFYHKLTHLHHLIGLLHDAHVNDSSVFLAAFYHDYIYVPGRSDNELKSARVAKALLEELGLNVTVINRVCDLIMATKIHQLSGGDNAAATFLDADMAIMGGPPVEYSDYVDCIRQEFVSIPSFLFNRGRKKFLAGLLKQERIFITDWCHEKYEAQARENITWELSRL
jgi:predicted metal-dependent HD superfamily phosphohydrolase